jgi:hypothetical protein
VTQENAEKAIRGAWIAGVISAAATLLFSLIAIAADDIFGIGAWAFIDVALILGLTLGIYKKSRAAASIMLAYWVVSKILLLAAGVGVSGLAIGVLFGYYFLQGVRGTFAYHRVVRATGVKPSTVGSH